MKILLAFLLLCGTASAQNLWTADHEENSLIDWSRTVGSVSSGGNYSSGGSVTTGTFNLNHTYVAKCTISGAYGRSVACRLLRWRDNTGKYFPKTAYYSVWIYIPKNYHTYSWWNVYQFKSQRPDGSTSDPVLTGNLSNDGTGYRFYFYNHVAGVSYSAPTRFPAAKWVKFETLFTYDTANATVKHWIDGQLVISKTGLKTKFTPTDKHLVWGPGNYTDRISGPDGNGNATVYFDNASVRVGP